jgi:isoquinoline 1-oxidoreductase alpha subunit
MIMTSAALLASNPQPTDADIDEALAGHICRCGTYSRIRKAVHDAAKNDAAKNRAASATPTAGAQ